MREAPRRILVTGGSGFIGRALVADLVEAGHDVTCLVRNGTRAPEFPKRAAEAYAAARRLASENLNASEPFELVFHLAAAGTHPSHRDSMELFDGNVVRAVEVAILAARWGAPLVITGSCSEYADPADATPIREDAPLQMRRLYGATKAAGTIASLATAEASGSRLAIARLFGVYGAGELPHRLLPALLARLRKNEQVPMTSGAQIRDFLWVRDVTAALRAIADHISKADASRAVFNVCSGEARSVADFSRAVCGSIGADPALLLFGATPLRPDDVPALVGDPAALARNVGWKPSMPFAQSLDAAIAEFD